MIKRLGMILMTMVMVFLAPVTCLADDSKEPAYVVMDANTGVILESQHADEKYYPASTTKILTIALALEYGNLDQTVVLDEHVRDRVEWDCSDAEMYPGEEVRLRDLIAAASLWSANEACNGIAQLIDGSQEAFVNRMNQKVSELGLQNTHFVTTNGLHDPEHYTTASDLAMLMRYCIGVQGFRYWLSLDTYTIPKTNQHDARELKQLNPLLQKDSAYYIDGIQCAKTGFTDQAGNCMVAYYEKEGQGLIVVVLNEHDTLIRNTHIHDLFTNTLANSQYIRVERSLYEEMLQPLQAQYLTLDGALQFHETSSLSGFTLPDDQTYQLEWASAHVLIGNQSHLGDIHILVDGTEIGSVAVYSQGFVVSSIAYTCFLEGVSIVLLSGVLLYIASGRIQSRHQTGSH